MNTTQQIVIYIIQAAASFYLLVVMVRFLLQLCRANFYNPVSQFIVKATILPLSVLQKVIPSFKNVNFACLGLALVVQILAIEASALVINGQLLPVVLTLVWAFVGIASLLLNIYFYGLLIAIVLSWVAPNSHQPAIALLWQLMDPVMKPFRQLLPPLGGLDLSPILIFLLLNVLRIFIHNTATGLGIAGAIVPGIM